jgi:hypothetical protein
MDIHLKFDNLSTIPQDVQDTLFLLEKAPTGLNILGAATS